MKISIAPVPYFWSPERLHSFYAQVARQRPDIAYLGETVCSKRRALRTGEWLELARELARHVPEVVLSTLTLIEAESELSTLKRLCGNGEFAVEANDVAAAELLWEQRVPFVAGPFLNIYHARSLAMFARCGAFRWVPPIELSGSALRTLIDEYATLDAPDVETELFAYGRAPLAHSARCFTARAHDRGKDNCDFICRDHAFGLPLHTREGDPFLTLNGIQVQSAAVHALTGLAGARAAGVDVLRLQVAGDDFADVLRAYRNGDNVVRLPGPTVDGYWRGAAGANSPGS